MRGVMETIGTWSWAMFLSVQLVITSGCLACVWVRYFCLLWGFIAEAAVFPEKRKTIVADTEALLTKLCAEVLHLSCRLLPRAKHKGASGESQAVPDNIQAVHHSSPTGSHPSAYSSGSAVEDGKPQKQSGLFTAMLLFKKPFWGLSDATPSLLDVETSGGHLPHSTDDDAQVKLTTLSTMSAPAELSAPALSTASPVTNHVLSPQQLNLQAIGALPTEGNPTPMHTASQTQTGTLQQPSPMKLDGEAPAPDGETPHAHDEGSLSVTEAFSSDDASEKADNDTAPAVLHHAGGHHQAQHGLQQSTADVGPVDSAESATPPFPEVPEDAASFGAGGDDANAASDGLSGPGATSASTHPASRKVVDCNGLASTAPHPAPTPAPPLHHSPLASPVDGDATLGLTQAAVKAAPDSPAFSALTAPAGVKVHPALNSPAEDTARPSGNSPLAQATSGDSPLAPTGQDTVPLHADGGVKGTGLNVEAAPWAPKQALTGSQEQQASGSVQGKTEVSNAALVQLQTDSPKIAAVKGSLGPMFSTGASVPPATSASLRGLPVWHPAVKPAQSLPSSASPSAAVRSAHTSAIKLSAVAGPPGGPPLPRPPPSGPPPPRPAPGVASPARPPLNGPRPSARGRYPPYAAMHISMPPAFNYIQGFCPPTGVVQPVSMPLSQAYPAAGPTPQAFMAMHNMQHQHAAAVHMQHQQQPFMLQQQQQQHALMQHAMAQPYRVDPIGVLPLGARRLRAAEKQQEQQLRRDEKQQRQRRRQH